MKSWVQFPAPCKQDMVVHLYSSTHEKMGVQEWQVQGHSWIYNKFEASLVYRRPYFHRKEGREGRRREGMEEGGKVQTHLLLLAPMTSSKSYHLLKALLSY